MERRITASRLHRGMECQAAMAREREYPDSAGASALEGRTAHKLAEDAFKFMVNADQLGQDADPDMCRHVNMYLNDVRQIAGHNAHIETCIDSERDGIKSRVYIDTHYLTADTLYIWDLKYGYGLVEPRDNWQMIMYAVAILSRLHEAQQPIPRRVCARIVQPRPWHPAGRVREWTFDADLWRNYANQIYGTAEKAFTAENPEYNTGPHCLYCRILAANACPAHYGVSMRAVDVATREPGFAMDRNALGAELTLVRDALAVLKQRESTLEQYGLTHGATGWQVDRGAGKYAWRDGVDPIALGRVLGVDLKAPDKPITPAQARDRKILTPDQLSGFTEKKPGRMTLVPVDNDRIAEVLKNGQ